jgi:hypothetical protein
MHRNFVNEKHGNEPEKTADNRKDFNSRCVIETGGDEIAQGRHEAAEDGKVEDGLLEVHAEGQEEDEDCDGAGDDRHQVGDTHEKGENGEDKGGDTIGTLVILTVVLQEENTEEADDAAAEPIVSDAKPWNCTIQYHTHMKIRTSKPW